MLVIPTNTATAALRRIPFTLVDATDLITPEDITVTGVKVTLSIAGGTPAASTNDIVKVNGAAGEYYIELTQAEANVAVGSAVRGYLAPSGCALTKMSAQIAAAGVVSEPVSDASISDAVLDEVVEGSYTLRQLTRLMASALLAKASGLATTTAVYRDLGDTKPRVTATVDADGNRSAVTLDAT